MQSFSGGSQRHCHGCLGGVEDTIEIMGICVGYCPTGHFRLSLPLNCYLAIAEAGLSIMPVEPGL